MRIYVFLLILFCCRDSYSQINFFQGSFTELSREAKKSKKGYFIEFYTNWCSFCKKMDATTFQDAMVANKINGNIFALKLDAEKEGKELSRSLGVKGYPTLVFFNASGDVLGMESGFKSPDKMTWILDKYYNFDTSKKLSFFDVNRNYIDQLKLKAIKSMSSNEASLVKSISQNALLSPFEWEEKMLDLSLPLEKQKRVTLYYHLEKKQYSEFEKSVEKALLGNLITDVEWLYFLTHLAERGEVSITLIKWANELALKMDDPFVKELRIVVLNQFGDKNDAKESFSSLIKDYKRKKIDREESLKSLGELFK